MANITLSQSLLDTDLSSLKAPGSIFRSWETATDEIYALATGELTFDDEPTKNGNTYSRKNPGFSSELGTGIALGSTSYTEDSDGDLVSSVTKITGASFDTGDGKATLKGTYSDAYSAKTGIYSRTQNYTEFSFKGDDKSSWSLKATFNATYSTNEITQTIKRTVTSSVSSVSATDSAGNSIGYSGNVKYNFDNEEWEGYFTTQTITIGKLKMVSAGLKLTYDDLNSGVEISSIAGMLPSLLAGNDVITLSSSDPIKGTVFGYEGNDKITGSATDDVIFGDGESVDGGNGNDTLIGAAGNDSLYGGYGNDSIDGGTGDDYIYGASGSDKLIGGPGNDTLVGYGLKDVLTGGAGEDTFQFHFYSNQKDYIYKAYSATVTDFSSTDDFLKIDTNDSVLSTDNFEAGKGLTKSNHSSIYFVYNTIDGKLYFDSDANGEERGVLIATFSNLPQITNENILSDDNYDTSDDDEAESDQKEFSTLKGTSNDEILFGTSKGDEIFHSTALDAAGGKDTITGGSGADHYYFNLSGANQLKLPEITDFKIGEDKIFMIVGNGIPLASYSSMASQGISINKSTSISNGVIDYTTLSWSRSGGNYAGEGAFVKLLGVNFTLDDYNDVFY